MCARGQRITTMFIGEANVAVSEHSEDLEEEFRVISGLSEDL